jgi:outer membrane protein assembly factor BamB
MPTSYRFAAAVLVSVALVGGSLLADWPGFRGPKGTGVSDDKDLPVEWTKDNFLWKVRLPGPGTASPIVVGDKIFVTCYTGYGTTLSKGMGKGGGFGKGKGGGDFGDQKKLKRLVLCLDAATGQVIWQKEIAPKLPETSFTDFVREHGYATNTPVCDGERLYVFFGKTGVLAFDLDGKQLWQADVGGGTNKWGTASSLLLYKDLVIVNAAMESKALLGLDKLTGKEVWRTGGIGTTWSSPCLVETKDGKQELVLSLPGKVAGYDPEAGKELWHCKGISSSISGVGGTYSTPVASGGVVYVTGGGGPGSQVSALAIKAGGRGDVNTTHVLWRQKAGTSFNSPVVAGDYLYCLDGLAYCLRTDTGKIVYKERLHDSSGDYVSAVVAGEQIFLVTRFDGVYVLASGEKFQKLAHNTIAGDPSIFNANPAVSNGRLYLRSSDYLYCIGKK